MARSLLAWERLSCSIFIAFAAMNFRWFAPAPDPIPEVLMAHELTRQFHREVECREAFDHYCGWYRATAEQHRQEFQKLQGDINLFGWFCRGLHRR
jgi:hypothetical protein